MVEEASRHPQTEVVVLGGGPGGYAAAFRAADLGKKVAIVDQRDHLGGVCLLEGCIPSKAMIAAAETLQTVRHAEEVGIVAKDVQLDMEKLADWRDNLLAGLVKGVEGLTKRRKIEWIQATARLADRNRLELSGSDESELRFEHLIIATGSRIVTPKALRPDGKRIITSREALALREVPKRLLVIGGGYIGLELGTAYRLLGSEVTIVELTETLLPGTDPDLVDVVAKALKAEEITVHLASEVTSLDASDDAVDVQIKPASGDAFDETYDYVLVAVGRRPNTDELGLESVGIETDDKGFIPVNEQCRTSVENIYAIGDVAPGLMLAHKARRQGIVAAEALCGEPAAFDNRTVPAVVFSHPEIAYCGLSEQEARDAGREVKTGRFWFRGNSRALTLRQTAGFCKVIADAESQQVLGVRIVGPGASELIAEATLAIEMGATLEDLIATIHSHPTLAETLAEAAEATLGQAIHFYDPRRRK